MRAFLMKVLFVQYLHEPTSADCVVALTPGAFQQCTDAGITPTAPDDHIERPLVDVTAYLSWQIRFFERLVGFDRAEWISRRLSAHMIHTPIDSLVGYARLLGSTLDALRPTAVCLQTATLAPPGPTAERHHLQFWPLLGDRPLASLVIPLLCAERGIPIEVDERARARGVRQPAKAQARAKAAVRRRGQLLQNFSNPAARLLHRQRGEAELICSPGYGMRSVAEDALRRGRRVLLADQVGDRIRILLTGTTAMRPLLDEPIVPLDVPRASVGPLLKDIDEWSGCSVGRLLRSRLERYLYDTCGRIEAAARLIAPVLEDADVREVWAANPFRVVDFAVLQAAGDVGAKRTLVQHGDQLFSFRSWLATETPAIDEMIVSDPTVPRHLTDAAHDLGTSVPGFRGDSPRIARFRSRHPVRLRDWDALPVCYVPMMFVGDSYVVEGGYFEDTDYYRWQLRLLNVFTKHRRSFIWKARPQANQADDPIPRQISQGGIMNVTYVTQPFTTILDEVGRVVTDFPSTAAFEAARAGHPLLALVHERFATPRPEAVDAFGPSALAVDSWEKAEAAIEAFLTGSAEGFMVDITKI